MTVIPEGAPADEVTVDHAGFIDKRAATNFEIKLRLGHGGHAAAFHAIGARGDFHTVTHAGDGGVFLEEITRYAEEILVFTNVLRRTAATEKDTEIVLGLDVGERDFRVHRIALPFLGDCPAGFVLVHHHLVGAFLRRGNHRIVAAFDQAEVGIHRVHRLSGIANYDQDLRFGGITHGWGDLSFFEALFQVRSGAVDFGGALRGGVAESRAANFGHKFAEHKLIQPRCLILLLGDVIAFMTVADVVGAQPIHLRVHCLDQMIARLAQNLQLLLGHGAFEDKLSLLAEL